MSDAMPQTKAAFGKLWWNLVSLFYFRVCLICLWFAGRSQDFAEKAQSAGERADKCHDALKKARADD